MELIRFWTNFNNCYECRYNQKKEDEQSKSAQYKELVFEILYDGKKRFPLSDDELYNIQTEIEDQTIHFDEQSIFKTVPNLIRLLIQPDSISAKEYLKLHFPDVNNISLLYEFGQYTIEALIVHVLCMMFNHADYDNSVIRVASLIEQLETSVRKQALFLKRRRNRDMTVITSDDQINEKNQSKLEKLYPIGSRLVIFLYERKLIEKISKKMMETWYDKINGIVTSYENYTRYICGDSNPSWEAHVKQWDNFQRLIRQKSDGSGFNYCVHY